MAKINTIDILDRTLNEMNSYFSSNEFSEKAKKNGLSKREIQNGVIALYLHHNAIQGSTRRMWNKNLSLVAEKQIEDKIADAISLLKKHKYKVFREVSEWVEI
jgi:AAA+ superfamily predicted ATPase